MRYSRLWTGLISVIIIAFAIIGYYGWRIYQVAPPIPQQVVTQDGKVLFTKEDILDGQNVWQSIGGQEVGSVWGHGAYIAPDWSADWLHRELTWILDAWSNEKYSKNYEDLDAEEQAVLKARLKKEIRTNTYDPSSGNLTVSAIRAQAIENVSKHYVSLFGNDPALADLREAYAIKENTIKDPERLEKITKFFFWASWSCATNRPDDVITYTSNWPGEPLIDNVPTAPLIIWSVLSFVLLLAGIGALTWYYITRQGNNAENDHWPEKDPLLAITPSPSMAATLKYFWVVVALIVVQIIVGVVTAHYSVEGSSFYGIPIDQILP